jgi:predicted AlkP superfamily pyrophosphatase or phosphodiesterase
MLGLFIVIGVTTSRKQKQFQKLYYNGTHFFDNTVIFISLDGFRSDYFERQITPNMQELGNYHYSKHQCISNNSKYIANQGIKAEHMYPSFPVSLC